MTHPQGSTWTQWDLHVHTPASLNQGYGGDRQEIWNKFFDDIESLPPEFKVLGINDYLFLDGYRRVLNARDEGRLQNIDLVLPVIELRLGMFGGSESALRRVNYHVIFSDEIDPDTIEHNFIYALSRHFRLTPEYEEVAEPWNSNLTRQSVEDLGRRIYETTPPSKRMGNLSFLHRGFSNLNFTLEDIRDKLEFHHFKDRHLTAIGNTEWASVKWNYQFTADKRDIINGVDIVFTSSESPEAWEKAKETLRESGVNHRLLDCSDAHFFSETVNQKDRVGNCYTWIKAAPTFEGLRQALREPEDRIFVGEEPEKVRLVRENKSKYVKSLRISRVPNSHLSEVWFDDELQFNTDLVAIIGNKGSGKSALVDVLGLAGDTRQHGAFSFLNKGKFRQPKDNKAQHFEAHLTWRSGKSVSKGLDDQISEHALETIKYIPQSFLEVISNDVASGGAEQFRRELESVIFSHVGDADRLGAHSLEGLIDRRTRQTYETINVLTDELRTLNALVVALEDRSTEEHRRSLEVLLASKKEELAAHDQLKPAEVSEPKTDLAARRRAADVSAQLEHAKLEYELWSGLTQLEEEQQIGLARLVSATEEVVKSVDNLRRRYAREKEEISSELNEIGIDLEDVAELQVNSSRLVETKQLFKLLRAKTDELLEPSNPNGYAAYRDRLDHEIVALQDQLDEPEKEYEHYLSAVETWRKKRRGIVGSKNAVGSIRQLEKELEDLDGVPAELSEVCSLRKAKAGEIYEEIANLTDTYRQLYRPVQSFIDEHPLARGKFDLNFEVSLVEENFEELFFEQISRGRSGSFYGGQESSTLLNEILERHDFDDKASLLGFLDQIMKHLHFDTRTEPTRETRVSEQLRQGHTVQSLYDFVFSLGYLKPRYRLRMGNKDLHQLSPGERGTLLLIFYLLVDKDNVPLIIDQPEENLDNHTVYDLLVPCIKEAKTRRQIFLVTHNPNLAVVCDAEQIVYASIDKKAGNRISYTAGPIEDPVINQKVLDILEGTRPAFNNRESKYSSGRQR